MTFTVAVEGYKSIQNEVFKYLKMKLINLKMIATNVATTMTMVTTMMTILELYPSLIPQATSTKRWNPTGWKA